MVATEKQRPASDRVNDWDADCLCAKLSSCVKAVDVVLVDMNPAHKQFYYARCTLVSPVILLWSYRWLTQSCEEHSGQRQTLSRNPVVMGIEQNQPCILAMS